MSKGNQRHSTPLVHIADGFHDDCDELISRCTKLTIVDYKSFCEIWKDMKLGCIYQDRVSGAEVAELSEEALVIAKYYMTRDTDNFEETVAGLFLIYALATMQPYPGFASLRLIPDDVPAIKRIEARARREERMDILYILGDVLIKRSQYHAVERERGMERQLRKYVEGISNVDKLGVRPKGVFYRQNEEMSIIRELGAITRQYARAKSCLPGSVSNTSLHYIDEKLPENLNGSLRKLIDGFCENRDKGIDSNDTEESDGEQQYSNVQAIKQKAMKIRAEPPKTLTPVQERKTSKRSPRKSELKSPTGKVKNCSPNKPTTPWCRVSDLPNPKKKKNNMWSLPEQTLDESPLIAESNDDVELDLEGFDQETSSNDGIGECLTVNDVTGEILPDYSNKIDLDNIEIDSLPLIIRTGQNGQSYQIEIIDQYRRDNTTDKRLNPLSEQLNPTALGHASEVRTKRSDDKNSKILLNKPPRRDLKRRLIQTKFKRMGMLPVANFEEPKVEVVPIINNEAAEECP